MAGGAVDDAHAAHAEADPSCVNVLSSSGPPWAMTSHMRRRAPESTCAPLPNPMFPQFHTCLFLTKPSL
jgi:hypothetical protein